MKNLALAFIIALVTLAGAATPTNGTATATLSWTAPAAYSDGTPMAATDISSYTVTYQSSASAAAAVKTVNVPAGTTTATVSGLCSTVNFSVTVTTTSTAIYPNATSSPGGPVPFVSSVTCVPNAPANFTAK